MLIQFSIKNFCSFSDEVVFDMSAVKAYKEHEYNLIKLNNEQFINKVSVIYGANASGKSNFIKAYDNFKEIIFSSANNKEEKDISVLKKLYNPYKFSSKTNPNIEFDSFYIKDNIEYRYGYIYNDKEIINEWLYKKDLRNGGRKVVVLERTNSQIVFGPSFKNIFNKYIDSIASDVLVLSFLNRLKEADIFRKVYDCVFSFLLIPLQFDYIESHFSNKFFVKNILERVPKKQVLNFLKSADSDIVEYSYDVVKEDIDFHFDHITNEGIIYPLPIDAESLGTKKAFILFLYFYLAIKNSYGLIIDEFSNHLHFLLQRALLNIFNKQSNQAQLIFTTHETSLLDKKYFRRDQIWFIEKKNSSSSMYSLAEFKKRNDCKYQKEYLSGEYGAIPIIKQYESEDLDGE